MSRSCHSATFSTAALALPRRTRARPVIRSVVIGFRLCGMALEPFCLPVRNGSSTSRTSVRCRCLTSVASRSSPAPASAIACSSSAWRSRATTCVETGSRCSPSRSSTRSSNAGDVDAYVPTAPLTAPTEAWANARCRRSTLRRASIAKPASLMPNVVGSAWTPCVRPTQTVPTCSRARSQSACSSSRAPRRTIAPADWICSASAVSSTSLDVRPKWIQRPASPAEALRTSTNAATSWSVIASRSWTAATVNVAARIAASSVALGPSITSHAATSTRRHASMRAPSVHRAPISGRV